MSLLTISSDLGSHFDHSGLPLSQVTVEIEALFESSLAKLGVKRSHLN